MDLQLTPVSDNRSTPEIGPQEVASEIPTLRFPSGVDLRRGVRLRPSAGSLCDHNGSKSIRTDQLARLVIAKQIN
jgi:hypothetical protein